MRSSNSVRLLLAMSCSWLSIFPSAQAQVTQDWREVYSPHDSNVLMTEYLLSFSIDTASNLYTVLRAQTPYVPLEQPAKGSLVVKHDSSGTYSWELATLDPLYNHVSASGDLWGNTYVTGPQHWYDSVEHVGGYLGIQTMKMSASGAVVYDILRECTGGSIWLGWINETGWVITHDFLGNAYVAGLREKAFPDPTVGNEIVILGYDPVGGQIFDITHTDGNDNFAHDIAASPDGSVFISGVGGPWGVSWQPLIINVTSGQVDWSEYFPDNVYNVFHKNRIICDSVSEPILSSTNYNTQASQLTKYSGSGENLWDSYLSEPNAYRDIDVDAGGYTYGGGGCTLTRHDPHGNLLWTRYAVQPGTVEECEICDIVARNDAVYASGWVRFMEDALWVRQFFTTKLDSAGNTLWSIRDSLLSYDLRTCKITVDDSARVYFAGVYTERLSPTEIGGVLILARYSESGKSLTIRDAAGESLPNVEFNLIKIANNPPLFDEDTVGTFTTDDKGRLALIALSADSFRVDLNLISDTLVVGNNLKIAKHVESEPARKHECVLGTMYSIHLDNMQIDGNGAVSFLVLDGFAEQEVVLNHAEYRYSLLVSVEWNAETAYLEGVQEGFRVASNYLYDVSDGQMRFDTIMLFDDNAFQAEADVRILATNMHHPDAMPNGIFQPGFCGDWHCGYPMSLPRKWYGGPEMDRDSTYHQHPLSTLVSDDYRTIVHEFGHYALAFYDEYLFRNELGVDLGPEARCLPRPDGNYGFMDRQYADATGGVRASEMSSQHRYADPACRNTQQFTTNGLSCWDFLESWAEGVKGPDQILVPILRPDLNGEPERQPTPGYDYIVGPNDNLAVPDYDIGYLVNFPEGIAAPPATTRSLHVLVDGVPAGGVLVTLRKPDYEGGYYSVVQGNTTDLGLIWVLGADRLRDHIFASAHSWSYTAPPGMAAATSSYRKNWLFGEVDLSVASDDDSLAMQLSTVTGDLPIIVGLCCEADSSTTVTIETPAVLPSPPSVTVLSTEGDGVTDTLEAVSGGYSTTVSGALGSSGTLRFRAEDDLRNLFFLDATFVISGRAQMKHIASGPGAVTVSLDSTGTTVEQVALVSTSYPCPITGLSSDAIQAGQTHTVSVTPGQVPSGHNHISIHYTNAEMRVDEGVIGDESTLQLYSWDSGSKEWVLLGGVVDTLENVVIGQIAGAGVYAAFTTNIITDVEDDERGEVLPYRFELSQNYPNPFNPVTTIEYSLPARSQVMIEIFNVLGQKVRTLVNEAKTAGSYRIEWNGSDDAGKPVSTGVYLYRFQAGDLVQTKKMLLIK